MATYKVPQDVEADDKLLGPFTFRQFIYLMIVFGLLMVAIGLFQIFPLLAIIPVPFMLFFAVLALPIRKDQPMETYLAALLSFYTKPNRRYWLPGQSESTILVTASKKVEAARARDITGDEASHRLSFLAELVDSEGHAIRSASTTMKDDFYAEAYNTTDMFERNDNYNLSDIMAQQQQDRRNAVVAQMRTAIENSEYNSEARAANTPMVQLPGQRIIQPREGFVGAGNDFSVSGAPATTSGYDSPTVVQPIFTPETAATPTVPTADATVFQPSDNLVDFRQSTPADRPAETLQQQSDRIRQENESEVYVSLH